MRRGGVALAAVLIVSGCAARQTRGMNRFVKQGTPTVEMGSPPVRRPRSFEAYVARVRELAVRERKERPPTVVPTVEARDPELASALLELALRPTAAAHRRIAERYWDLDILDASYGHFFRASQIDRADAAAYDGLARIWRQWGFPQLGVADADRAIHYAPRWAPAHNTRGTLLTALGRRAEARREYEEAVRLDPNAAYSLNNLCYLSFLEGNPARAAEECRAALDVDPQLKAARNNLALARVAAGRTDLARSDFVAATGDTEAFYNIGIAEMAARHYAAAITAFDAARKARPTWAAAQDRARQARRLLQAAGASE